MSGPRHPAERLSHLALELISQIDDSARRARAKPDTPHIGMFCALAAAMEADILTETLLPLYEAHPELRPAKLR